MAEPDVLYEARCVRIATGECWWRGPVAHSEKEARAYYGRHAHPCQVVMLRFDFTAGYWRDVGPVPSGGA